MFLNIGGLGSVDWTDCEEDRIYEPVTAGFCFHLPKVSVRHSVSGEGRSHYSLRYLLIYLRHL